MTEREWDKRLHIHTIGREDEANPNYSPYEPTPYSVLERLADSGYNKRRDHLLDYGCGKGRVAFFMASVVGCRVTGIDHSQKLIDIAKENRSASRLGDRITLRCCLAEQYEPQDENVFFFPDIMLYIPIEWEDAITVEQTDTGLAFFQTASYDKFLEDGLPKGGFLFKLRASEDEDFRELPEYEYIGFSENAGLHFYLSMPSDYQAYVYDDDIRAEYDAMNKQIAGIAEMAKIHRSMHFYPEGIESTDPGMS